MNIDRPTALDRRDIDPEPVLMIRLAEPADDQRKGRAAGGLPGARTCRDGIPEASTRG